MKVFKYTGITKFDRIRTGTIRAESVDEAMERLSGLKEVTTLVDQGEYEAKYVGILIEKIQQKKFGVVDTKELSGFFNRLAGLIDAKIGTMSALEKSSMYGTRSSREIPNRLLKHMRQGQDLAQAFAEETKYFKKDYSPVVRAGFEAGTLPETLRRLSIEMKADEALRRQINAALAYPKFLVLFGVVAVIAIFGYLLPELLGLMTELMSEEVPPLTQVMIDLTNFFAKYGAAILIVLSLAVIAATYVVRKFFMLQFDTVLLKIPLFGEIMINRDVIRLFRSLGNLIAAKVSTKKALEIATEGATNRCIRRQLERCCRKLDREGLPLVQSLQGCVAIRPLDLQILAVGQDTGRLTEMLLQRADELESENTEQVRKATSLIEPIAMMFVAALIGVIAIAVYLPMFSMMSGTIA